MSPLTHIPYLMTELQVQYTEIVDQSEAKRRAVAELAGKWSLFPEVCFFLFCFSHVKIHTVSGTTDTAIMHVLIVSSGVTRIRDSVNVTCMVVKHVILIIQHSAISVTQH